MKLLPAKLLLLRNLDMPAHTTNFQCNRIRTDIAGRTSNVVDHKRLALLYFAVRQDKLGKGEIYVADGNLSLESNWFDSLPVKSNH